MVDPRHSCTISIGLIISFWILCVYTITDAALKERLLIMADMWFCVSECSPLACQDKQVNPDLLSGVYFVIIITVVTLVLIVHTLMQWCDAVSAGKGSALYGLVWTSYSVTVTVIGLNQ